MNNVIYSHDLLRNDPVVFGMFNRRGNKKDSFARWYSKNKTAIYRAVWSTTLAN